MADDSVLRIKDLGIIDYAEAYQIQKEMVKQVLDGQSPALLLCEHPPVLTMGRMGKSEHILWSADELRDKGISVEHIDRGGDITLHAPGQLVAYPILDLTKHGKDLHLYLRKLEEVSIRLLADYKIEGRREPGKTGVWVGLQKVVSMGIGVKRWVSFHGVGINVSTDLRLFSLIQPCGLNVEMTSISNIIGSTINMTDAKSKFVQIFEACFMGTKGENNDGSVST